MIIAVCGPPRVGKTTLIKHLLHHTGSPGLQVSEDTNGTLMRRWGVITTERTEYIVMNATGLHEREVMETTIPQADALIYVSRAVLRNGTLYDPIGPRDLEFFRDAILAGVIKYHKGWTKIPWLYVLNKVDIADASLLDAYMAQFPIPHCRTIAHKGIGIDLVWNHIQALP